MGRIPSNSQKLNSKSIVALSVLIPTVGRVVLLNKLLVSLRRNDVSADEIIIVDQSGETDSLLEQLDISDLHNVRVIESQGVGIASNLNLGMRAANNRVVLITHDDCEVYKDWIGTAYMLHERYGGLITGNVYPPEGYGEGEVPATRVAESAVQYSGKKYFSVLYPNNMVVDRELALSIDGFDERNSFNTAGEDLDFAFRWLKESYSFRLEPSMKVIHNDWRNDPQLKSLYQRYAMAAGAFYCKCFMAGEYTAIRWFFRDIKVSLLSWIQYFTSNSDIRNWEVRLLIPNIVVGFIREVFFELRMRISR